MKYNIFFFKNYYIINLLEQNGFGCLILYSWPDGMR